MRRIVIKVEGDGKVTGFQAALLGCLEEVYS
jgi:hypothetical protein